MTKRVDMSRTPIFVKIARPTYGRLLRLRYNIKTEGYERIPNDGPFLLLSNHVHTLDPFFISVTMKAHVRWVAGAYLFKNRFLKTLLGSWVTSISKQQGRSDLETIRAISQACKKGDVVGIFPEGTRTWDGEAIPINETTAKLVRLFNVPIVILNLEGGYGLKPRWATVGRKGSLCIRVVRTITREELQQMQLSDIEEALSRSLDFCHQQWQVTAQIPYRSSRRAEGIERLLYLCPDCQGKSTMRAKKNIISCHNCDLRFKLDDYDNLILEQGNPHGVDTVPAWHRWQYQKLEGLLAADGPLFPQDEGVLLQRGFGKRLLTLTKRFSLSLESKRMVVVFPKKFKVGLLQGLETLIFDFTGMQSMIINVKNTLEFYHDDQLWRIRISADRSILKYVELFNVSKGLA